MKEYKIVYLGTENNEKSFIGLKEILEQNYNVSLVVAAKNPKIRQPHLSKIDSVIALFIFIGRIIRKIFRKYIGRYFFPIENKLDNYCIRKLCIKYNIPIITYASSNICDIKEIIRKFEPDIIISNGWQWYIPKSVVEIAKIAALNCHSSYLPCYKGGNVTFAPLINKESKSGVTVHLIEEKYDSGKILSQIPIEVSQDEIPQSLNHKRAKITGEALIKALEIVGKPEKYKENLPSSFYKRFSYASYKRLKLINKFRRFLGLKIKKVEPTSYDKL